jgi:phosphoribosyl 1,2-cyclic phosphodiesterase
MRVISLGSGSSGNSLLIEAGPRGRTKLLVDAGFADRTLIQRLCQAGVSPAQLQSVLVTHEHTDHILGLPMLMKRHAVPVVADGRTLEAIEQIFASEAWQTELAAIDQCADTLPQSKAGMEEQLRTLAVGSRIAIGDIEVTSFPVSHDAVAPCGYLLSAGGCRVCVVIDSGEVTPAMLEAMYQADLLVLESNHDREKLLRGPYPYSLKRRILSSTGHLSNDQAADAVLRTWRTDSVRWLWLSHLSRTNNTPKIALSSMISRIKAARANLAQVHITVLPPDMGGIWDSTQLWHAPSLWEMQV